MLHKNLSKIINVCCISKSLAASRSICSTPVYNLNQKWRQERGLPLNPNASGVLTDGPDYTFLDGRLTPYGVRQKNRILKQQEVAQQIMKLTAEVDFAVERHRQLQIEDSNRKEGILKSKLKPKGLALLRSK